MRLSQLARQLEVSPSELIIFFKKNNIDRYASPNNKVSENDADFAFENYKLKTDQDEKEAGNIDDNKTISEKDVKDSTTELIESDDNIPPKNIIHKSKDHKKNIDNAELIRMPKIKLQGVKVVGKIDLPEPSIKTADKQDTDQMILAERAEAQKTAKKRSFDKGYSKTRNKGKPHHAKKKRELTYEEKIKREEKKRSEEQQKLKKLRKEQKKQHYIRNVQPNVQSSKKRKKAKTIVEVEEKPKVVEPVHKNPLKRIWAWLNGKYDEY